ncbi:MAG: hypothetical protein NC914_01785 [Candidatus Omnitrophica bacterium]|nr:hypothetical protein [Candidatus Omnitrophota bacterium]
MRIFINHPVRFNSNTIPDPILGFRLISRVREVDTNGFCNDRVYQQADIVTLGDSRTYGFNIKSTNSWTQKLGQISGYSKETVA